MPALPHDITLSVEASKSVIPETGETAALAGRRQCNGPSTQIGPAALKRSLTPNCGGRSFTSSIIWSVNRRRAPRSERWTPSSSRAWPRPSSVTLPGLNLSGHVPRRRRDVGEGAPGAAAGLVAQALDVPASRRPALDWLQGWHLSRRSGDAHIRSLGRRPRVCIYRRDPASRAVTASARLCNISGRMRMLRVDRLLLTAVCATVLVGVGSWTRDVVSGQQSQAAQSSIDPLVLKAMQWRSIGPDCGGRSIAVAGVKGRPKKAISARSAADSGRRSWRCLLGTSYRRTDQERIGRCRSRLGNQPGHRLHRHGRVVHPRQHHAR